MCTVEVLNSAADLIERDGLHKGDYWPGQRDGTPCQPGVPCCVHGALAVASGLTVLPVVFPPLPAANILRWNLRNQQGVWVVHLADWNDAEERTAEDVVTALRAAAEFESSITPCAAAQP